jgi:hypothetical protein
VLSAWAAVPMPALEICVSLILQLALWSGRGKVLRDGRRQLSAAGEAYLPCSQAATGSLCGTLQ